jgi:hypothetical protein
LFALLAGSSPARPIDGNSNIDAVKSLIQDFEFDCIFFEFPNNLMADSNGQFVGPGMHPASKTIKSDNSFTSQNFAFYKWLVDLAAEKSIKIFHSDIPANERLKSDMGQAFRDNINLRNRTVAQNIANAFSKHLCHRGVSFFGLGHLMTKLTEGSLAQSFPVTPIQHQVELKDFKLATVSYSNLFMEYFPEENRKACFSRFNTVAIKTSNPFQNSTFPITMTGGQMTDFDYILIPKY